MTNDTAGFLSYPGGRVAASWRIIGAMKGSMDEPLLSLSDAARRRGLPAGLLILVGSPGRGQVSSPPLAQRAPRRI